MTSWRSISTGWSGNMGEPMIFTDESKQRLRANRGTACLGVGTTHGACVISLPRSQVEMTEWDGLFSIRAVVVKRFQANNSNFCRSRARASLRDQPLALPAWDQQEETEQSDSRTDRGRAIDTRVQSELVSSIVPRGTSLRWIVAPTVWRSSLRLSAPFPLSSGTRFHHSTCDA